MALRDRAPDQRIAKGAPATLQATLTDADGEVDYALSSDVTVTVTRLDGTTLINAQPATVSSGVATYALTAAQTGAGLDVLTASWTHNGTVRTTTYHEVVGRHWFAPSALRSVAGVDKALQALPGDGSTQSLVSARTWVESLIEWATNVAWVPRVQLDTLNAYGHDEVVLSRPWARTLRSLTIDGSAETVGDWTITPYGTLRRSSGGAIVASQPLGVHVLYDHGADAPPADLREAAVLAAADWIKTRISTIDLRATGFSGESGTISYARLDRDHPTGIPRVDEVIRAHRFAEIGVA